MARRNCIEKRQQCCLEQILLWAFFWETINDEIFNKLHFMNTVTRKHSQNWIVSIIRLLSKLLPTGYQLKHIYV